MKIKEVTERDCCHSAIDLKPYKGEPPRLDRANPVKLKFCVHCGQLWHWDRAPGDMDYGWEKFPFVEAG